MVDDVEQPKKNPTLQDFEKKKDVEKLTIFQRQYDVSYFRNTNRNIIQKYYLIVLFL